jgi:sporulation protein YlmC with PRC-barrel domain
MRRATTQRTRHFIEIAIAAAVALFVTTSAATQAEVRLLSLLPPDTNSVTDFYDQPVYDSTDQKVGTIVDLLIDRDGQVRAAMITVGGFLGLPSKHVAVPFTALQLIPKERKPHIVLDFDKRALREARGFLYNLSARRWERAED